VLTGGAYLHIAGSAPALYAEQAESAMALFASTSPSYLILESLDQCNAVLAGGYREEMAGLCHRVDKMKRRLRENGYEMIGDEPAKITVAARRYGYTGEELHGLMRENGVECEFSDPDFLTMMLTPLLTEEEIGKAEKALLSVSRRATLPEGPGMPAPARALSVRQALFSPGREVSVEDAEGSILADAQAACPPCVPILVCGERISREAVDCFRYYGIKKCRIVCE